MIDYEDILLDLQPHEKRDAATLTKLFWPHWLYDYRQMSPWKVSPYGISIDSFEYEYDDFNELIAKGLLPEETEGEGRVIVAHGTSTPHGRPRDDYRLRGWPATLVEEGKAKYDRGHFIANSIGGIVDGSEVNVFRHRRDINQGHSVEGKRFRLMEKYCANNPGVYLFTRPIWAGSSPIAEALEYGILRPDGSLWVETFPNH